MKSNYVHVCFVIDESGSMSGREADVVGGFKKVIDEQKENVSGSCSISYYKFATTVKKVYIGTDVNSVEYLDGKYKPCGLTALYDGIGTAIDEIGKWLSDMPEEERPEKNLIVVMTDGEENHSSEYTASKVKEMIKHQEEKYNWTFVYMGSDLSNAQDANNLGFTTRCFSSSDVYGANYSIINDSISAYRNTDGDSLKKAKAMSTSLNWSCNEATIKYAKENNLDASSLISQIDDNEEN
jgi:uncharacterized protein YegL